MKIKSTFAIEVSGKTRYKLTKLVKEHATFQEELRIPVVIYGYIDKQLVGDDGVSIEFTACVERVEVI